MTSAALATLSLAAPAHATNNDLFVCRMTDTHHNALVYSFGYNTMASRGAQGAGTYVEVAFAKNGQFVSSPVGSRPIWTWADNVNGGAIVQNNDPRYAMGIKYDPSGGRGQAVLLFNQTRQIAWGTCGIEALNPAPAAPAPVRDNGYVPGPAPAPVTTDQGYVPGPAATAAPVAPAPAPVVAAAPPVSDRVALESDGSNWYVYVKLGSTTHKMGLDTGASTPHVHLSSALTLVGNGEATWGTSTEATLADGTVRTQRTITINHVSIGSLVADSVVATVGNDDNGVELLGSSVLNRAGRFTIDAQAHLIIFG